MQFIDLHCDTITTAFDRGVSMEKNDLHIDFKRLTSFNAPVQFFAVWLNDECLKKPFESTIKYIEFFRSELNKTKYPIQFARSYTDIIYNRNRRVSSALLAIEGGEAIEGDLDNIHRLREQGARIFTLTWNRKNTLGAGALSGCEEGLTDLGKAAVKELNKADMFIDVSHLNEVGFYDVCSLTEKPIIASHSNSYEVCPFPRNLKDDQIKEIAKLGGVIGFNLCADFIRADGKPDHEDVIRQIEHILNIGGENVLGLGCDYDGITNTPKDLEDVGCSVFFFNLIEKYLGEDIAQKIFYANLDMFLQDNL
ncbi:MAG: dipeptidase [Clostridiales bacterium]|nr:dipeptidase [Clostridiales bacterium]